MTPEAHAVTTDAPDPPEQVAFDSSGGRWVLAVAVLGSGLAFLDGTVVNVALPEIGRDLDASTSSLQWILNGYLLTLASLILLGGSLGDRYGRRRVFLLGASRSPPPRCCARSPRTASCSFLPGCCRGLAERC
jgi:MFS family permease